MAKPLVSVLMTVYNSEDFVGDAIESILNQTYKNYEFIIVDDASDDNSENIVKSYKDKRIKYIRNQENKGLTFSLNKGIDIARGDYIARLDSDDLAAPSRLKLQMECLNSDKDIVAIGSWAKIFGKGKSAISQPPLSSDMLKAFLLFGNVFIHSSMVFKRKIKDEIIKYNNNFNYAEDYELWVRLSRKGKMVNLPDVLVGCRKHDKQKTAAYTDILKQKVWNEVVEIFKYQFNALGIELDNNTLMKHKCFAYVPFNIYEEQYDRMSIENWLFDLIAANQASNIYETNIFKYVLALKWLDALSGLYDLGNRTYINKSKYWLDILSLHKELPTVKKYQVASLYKSLGLTRQAKNIFLEFDKNEDKEFFAGVQFHLGEIALKEKRHNDAVYNFKSCLKLNPTHKAAKKYLCILLSS